MEKTKNEMAHPFGLRNRPEMLAMRNTRGNEGYAVTLFLLEEIAEKGSLPRGWMDIEVRCADYRVTREALSDVEHYGIQLGIFAVDDTDGDGCLVSPLLDGIVASRNARKEAGRKGARKRWEKPEAVLESEDDLIAVIGGKAGPEPKEAIEGEVEDLGTYVGTVEDPVEIEDVPAVMEEAPIQEEPETEPEEPVDGEPITPVVEEPHQDDIFVEEEITALPTDVLYPRHAQFTDAVREYYNAFVVKNDSRMPKCSKLSSEMKSHMEHLLVTLGKDFLKKVIETATKDPNCEGDFEWLMSDEVLLEYYRSL